MDFCVTWYVNCSYVNYETSNYRNVLPEITPWQLYEECEDKFDALTNDLDKCQRALTSGEDRGTLILQVPKQYAHCELRPLPIRVILDERKSDHLYDGYHSLSNLQDELTTGKKHHFLQTRVQ